MFRAGMIRKLASGIYSYLPFGLRALQQVESIIREEMNAIGGQEITVEQFEIGDRVDVIGTSKGKGFAGTIKRWNFHRGPMGHGSMSHRAPGSIGCSAYPSRVVRGKKMPGQMGNARVTMKNLEVVDVRPEENLLVVRGAVPGPRQGLVLIQKAG